MAIPTNKIKLYSVIVCAGLTLASEAQANHDSFPFGNILDLLNPPTTNVRNTDSQNSADQEKQSRNSNFFALNEERGPLSRNKGRQGSLNFTTDPFMLSRAGLKKIDRAILRYKRIVRSGGWSKIKVGGIMKNGVSGPRVKKLRKRLSATGDLKYSSGFDDEFSSKVEDAVKIFQKRHGLHVSGIVYRKTLRALNIDARARLRQLKLNRSRLELLLRHSLPSKFVFVNIPASELLAVRDGVVERKHRVVVGKPQFPTPVLRTNIIALNFYPYWHVPDSIARRDIIPKLNKNVDYLLKTKTRVYTTWGGKELDPYDIDWSTEIAKSYKFRQDPGPENALGYLRLNMPNKHAVYLHDTPIKKLFGRSVRAYSAGCVRVQSINVLGNWLLQTNREWDQAKIDQLVESQNNKTINLINAVPVFFEYFTAWVGPSGTINFRPDIYSKDKLNHKISKNSVGE